MSQRTSVAVHVDELEQLDELGHDDQLGLVRGPAGGGVGAAAALAIGRVPHVPNHQLHKLHLAKPELVADRGRDEGVADGAELGVGPGEVWGFGFWCGRRTDLAGRRIIVFLAILSGASSRLALPTWRRPTTACAGRRSIRRSMAGGRVGTGPGVGGAGQGPGGWAVDGRRAGPSSLLWWRPGLVLATAGWVGGLWGRFV